MFLCPCSARLQLFLLLCMWFSSRNMYISPSNQELHKKSSVIGVWCLSYHLNLYWAHFVMVIDLFSNALISYISRSYLVILIEEQFQDFGFNKFYLWFTVHFHQIKGWYHLKHKLVAIITVLSTMFIGLENKHLHHCFYACIIIYV